MLVTGAGGSVGSELCARLAGLGVRELVLVDQAEGPLVALAGSLHGLARATPVLVDIRSPVRTAEVFDRHRPDVVFHAAAYKQVPLLESFPVEGAAVNVLGTKAVADAARHAGVERLVLFSTDKAVHPTSVLGLTKAVAEWIVAAAAERPPGRRYACVRLGNVVDSAGSIVPLFRSQIARGGPVTVTHPDATRYLVTAGEAAGLAVVAGALAGSRSVFWLDAGPPVRVVDLAHRLGSNGSVTFVGLRAGERLHEHQCARDDEVSPTPCERVLRSALRRVDPGWLDERLAVLEEHVRDGSAEGVRATLEEMLRTAAPPRDEALVR